MSYKGEDINFQTSQNVSERKEAAVFKFDHVGGSILPDVEQISQEFDMRSDSHKSEEIVVQENQWKEEPI